MVVNRFRAPLGHEINFRRADFADVDGVSAPEQLEIDDVLKQMPPVGVAVSEQHLAQPRVDGVILFLSLQVLFPLHVETAGLIDDEARHHGMKVSLHGLVIRFASVGGQGVGDFLC